MPINIISMDNDTITTSFDENLDIFDHNAFFDYSMFRMDVDNGNDNQTNILQTSSQTNIHNSVLQTNILQPALDLRVSKNPLINFGLHTSNTHWKLLHFISTDVINKLPLLDEQICQYSDLLDWDLLSKRNLSGPIFVKYAKKINWGVFLRNGYPKEIDYLIEVEYFLYKHLSIFFEEEIKRLYYTVPFINEFPNLIDWKWCVVNVKLPEMIILKYWEKLTATLISQYQIITTNIAKKRLNYICWNLAVKNQQLDPAVLEIAGVLDVIDWKLVCQYQKLSEIQLFKYAEKLDYYIISKYQQLSDNFIDKYNEQLYFDLLAETQNMSVVLINKYNDRIDMKILSKNPNYNTINKIQVLFSGIYWFIIEPPIIGDIQKINYIELPVNL